MWNNFIFRFVYILIFSNIKYYLIEYGDFYGEWIWLKNDK